MSVTRNHPGNEISFYTRACAYGVTALVSFTICASALFLSGSIQNVTGAESNAAIQGRISTAHHLATHSNASSAADLWSRYQQEPNHFVRAAVIDSLAASCGKKCLNQFETALHDTTPEVRIETVQALGNIGGVRARDLLLQVLAGDANEGVRMSAAFWLGNLNDASAVKALGHALSADADPHVRAQAAHALKRLPSGNQELKQGRNDPDVRIRKIANAP